MYQRKLIIFWIIKGWQGIMTMHTHIMLLYLE